MYIYEGYIYLIQDNIRIAVTQVRYNNIDEKLEEYTYNNESEINEWIDSDIITGIGTTEITIKINNTLLYNETYSLLITENLIRNENYNFYNGLSGTTMRYLMR